MFKNVKTTVAVAAGALALGLLGASPALAGEHRAGAPTVPAHVHDYRATGTVIARTGVNVRSEPNTGSRVLDTYPYGATIALRCKTRGENVDGNSLWYKVEGRTGWVTARYVRNNDPVPWC
ncbi:SH3 domain-containing protein [Streptomyces alkaliphilus]|uniref:SH3 domain-containing protein n=1 Tax=Streptomyces alkaliphilus TaxID=1472722 RepID=A0A7W3TBD9_9ACTN|nr:SH3 domain-containing protein [Streptomyces alkaliphilus]MBB0243736.1 SH3 domain-containing protein [Streptomyces alkaliphilus]